MRRRCSKGRRRRHEDSKAPAFLEQTFWWGRQTANAVQNSSGARARGWGIPFGKLAITRGQENLSTEVTLEQGPESREEAGDAAGPPKSTYLAHRREAGGWGRGRD